MFYDNKTRRFQTYVLMSWIRIDFYGSRLRSWSFLCVTFHASLFVHALWVFTSKITQTSLGIHPKPKTSFCDHLLVHNPIWVWVKFSMEIQIFRKIMKFILTLAVIPLLSFMLKDEHRSSTGGSHYIISDKCYVSIMLQKVLRSKRKKWKNMMIRKEK
jgi:hypothetical protein